MTKNVSLIPGYFSRLLGRQENGADRLVQKVQEASEAPFKELKVAYENFLSQLSQPQLTGFPHANQQLAEQIVKVARSESLFSQERDITRIANTLLTNWIPNSAIKKLNEAVTAALSDSSPRPKSP